MKYYVRGRKQNDQKDKLYEIGGPYSTQEIAEVEAEKARTKGWILVGVTTAPMPPVKK